MLTDPGARKYMREADHSGWTKVGGENFFYMGPKGRKWANQQAAADRANKTTDVGPDGHNNGGGGVVPQPPPVAKAQQNRDAAKSAPVTHGGNTVHAPISVNATDPHAAARIIQAHLDKHTAQQARALRGGNFDWTA